MREPVQFAAAVDPEGRDWIRNLPDLTKHLCGIWDLEIVDLDTRTGYHSVVYPVERRSEKLALKLTWPAERTVDESRALAAWNGQGAVRLVDVNTEWGALLLERLDFRRTLSDLEIFEVARVAGGLLRQLAIPDPGGFRDLRTVAAEIARSLEAAQKLRGIALPHRWFEVARTLALGLAVDAGTGFLIHADLHYGNVLAGDRLPWVAIDPKPVAGEPEYAVPELLWTRADELASEAEIRQLLTALVECGGLDADRARAWAIVRCADYWLWGLDRGLTEDPRRCRRIQQALL